MNAHTVDFVSQRLLKTNDLFRKHDSTVILIIHSRKSLYSREGLALRADQLHN